MIPYSPIPTIPSVPAPTGALATLGTETILLTPLINKLILLSGLSQAEICRRMGIQPQSLNQYTLGKRKFTSLNWLVRLVEVCGGRVILEFPRGPMEPDKAAGGSWKYR